MLRAHALATEDAELLQQPGRALAYIQSIIVS